MRALTAAAWLLACAGCVRPHPSAPDASTPPDAGQPLGPTGEALARASAWMAQFPEAQLRFDAAVGLTEISRRWSSGALAAALVHARRVADADADNPLRRFFQPDFTAPIEATSRWEVPKPGDPRINPNRVLSEALHCKQNGLRPQALDYLGGPMRDGGGYQTTHALWALTVAAAQGCLSPDELKQRAAPLVAELRQAQPAKPGPTAQEVDLFAERVLMRELAGEHGEDVSKELEALRAAQAPDGAFGAPEPGYLRFHATFVACWALASSLGR